MVFKKSEDASEGESEAWNNAIFFIMKKVLIPLAELDDLEDIARFGTLRQDEDLQMSDDQVDRRRADAVKRYWNKLKQIIRNTRFKITKNKEMANLILENVMYYKKYLDQILLKKDDDVHHEDRLEVDEKKLNWILDILVNYTEAYIVLLDKTGMIFKVSPDADLEKIAEQFIHGG